MISDIFHKQNTSIGTRHKVPAVSIIMPFEHVMYSKSKLELRLKKAARIAEAGLMKHFTAHRALPVIARLQLLLREVNYNIHKKSVAIFVSPLTERVLYLDFPVEEKVVVDKSFGIRDLVLNKKEIIQYLVLLLNEQKSKLYLGNGSELQLIKSNQIEDISTCKINIAEQVSNPPGLHAGQEMSLNNFLYNMDYGLSLILKAYNLPVFIIAPGKMPGDFKTISKNSEKFVAFIHEDYIDMPVSVIVSKLEPYLQDWENLKRRMIMQEVEKAAKDHKLALGVADVCVAVLNRSCRLLVVEKSFVDHTYFPQNGDEYHQFRPEISTPFYIKDSVDDVIEKVLKSGGDVELVDELKNYSRIALLEY